MPFLEERGDRGRSLARLGAAPDQPGLWEPGDAGGTDFVFLKVET